MLASGRASKLSRWRRAGRARTGSDVGDRALEVALAADDAGEVVAELGAPAEQPATGVAALRRIMGDAHQWPPVRANQLAQDPDADDNDYSGANKYVVHFEKGQAPPVEGFWSITMYDGDYFFVPNSINRYSISPRQALKTNADGSIDLYVQKESPGADRESNWLPAPAGKFILMLRMYWPDESSPSIINGTWTIPPVRRAP